MESLTSDIDELYTAKLRTLFEFQINVNKISNFFYLHETKYG